MSLPQSNQPTELHRQLVDVIEEIVNAAIDQHTPVMGRVVSDDADGLRVRVDGETQDRSVGLSRTRGQAYQTGDRVLLVPNAAGDHVVAGGFVANRNQQRALLDDGDIAARSITGKSLADSYAKDPHAHSGSDLVNFGRGTVEFRDQDGNKFTGSLNDALALIVRKARISVL